MLLPFVALVLVFAMSYAPLLGWSYAFVGYTLDANLANLRFSVQALAAQLTPVEADAFEHKGTGSFASDKYFRKVYNVNKYPHHGGYMKQTLDLLKFSAKIGRADCARAESVRLSCGRDEMMRFCWDALNPVGWPDAKYLVCDVTGDRDWSQVFIFEFWDREGGHDAVYPDLTVRMSVLPKVKTRLCLPLRALDAQSIFLPRTRGQLRSFITGSAVARDRIETFAIGMREGPAEQGITVEGLYLTDELPDFPLPDVKLVDSLGQNKLKDWAGKTHSEREMVDALRAEFAAVTDSGAAAATAAATAAVARPGAAAAPREAHSQYGGLLARQYEATGYFRVLQENGVWWLVDPDGCAYFGAGLDCVRPGEEGPVNSIADFFDWLPERGGEFAPAWHEVARWAAWEGFLKEDLWQFSFAEANLIRAFGEKWHEAWLAITKSRMREWGFNSVGVGSDRRFLREARVPYVYTLTGYPSTERQIYRDFPDVFSEEFQNSARQYARQLEALAQDRCLIGYFMRNEPQWAFAYDLEIAEELLAAPGRFASKDRLIETLREKYGTIGALNAAWNLKLESFEGLAAPMGHASRLSPAAARDIDAFSRQMIREYVRVPALACKSVDANHLNLGMRYAFILYPNQAAGKEFLDVFSINSYKIDPTPVLTAVADIVKMPVMIGEFHFGALDVGVAATGIIGVENQEERGKAYQYYLEKSAAMPECVGVQYFILNDQMTLGRPDGENYQIGFVDCCHRPYAPIVEGALRAHARMYDVHAGALPPTDVVPKKITPNMAS